MHKLEQSDEATACTPPSPRPGPSRAPDEGSSPPAPVIYAPLDLGREEEVGSIEAAQAMTPEVQDDEVVLFEIADRHFLIVDRGIQVNELLV